MSYQLHQKTPVLTSMDGRGAGLRTVAYHRVAADEPASTRATLQRYDARGHRVEQWDPRLSALAETDTNVMANQKTCFSLSGQALRNESVDAGRRVTLYNAAKQTVFRWDGRGTRSRCDFDEQLRPVALFEIAKGQTDERCDEHFVYAATGPEDARRNRCGRVLRHDDPAGSLWHEAFAVSGQPLIETRRFCTALTPPDWPDAPLQTESYITRWKYDALGALIAQTDAANHVRTFDVDIAGRPYASQLDDVVLLKSCEYSALDQVQIERTGNNVLTLASYSPANGRLLRLKSTTQTDHLLQDLHYQYDPVGNIERIEDLAQPVQWFAQQRIEAINTYRYDTLYQLIEATGRENASQRIGPGLPGLELFGSQDDSRWRNYSQTYSYDSGNNLTTLKHDAGAGNTVLRHMAVAEYSNRSLLMGDGAVDFAGGFDANGNQQQLAPGQWMLWDTRNQLHQVTQVVREAPDGQDDDVEIYIYDSEGQRVRKVRRAKTGGGEQISQVLYLPGLEVRTQTTSEELHVVTAQAGRNHVRVLHWAGIGEDQWRYSLNDHLGSSTLELNETGELISQESFYPYGGTSWWAARSRVHAQYKTVRYSGKERDATGLYYYGMRYYAPWLQRWISTDPAGDIDGLNLFRMVQNNPVTLIDLEGLAPKKMSDKKQQFVNAASAKLADLLSDSGQDTDTHKNIIRDLMKSEHPAIKIKRFDTLWPLVLSEAKSSLKTAAKPEAPSTSINRSIELGRGGDAVSYDQGNGYIIKEFHKPITDFTEQKREVDIFNRLYGVDSASILSNTMIKMKKLQGEAISEMGVGSFSNSDATALIDTLKAMHDKNIYHGDLHYSNILFDKDSRTFSIIDFGTSRLESDPQVLQEEMEDFKMNFIYMWPGYTRRPAPSIQGNNGRLYI